MFMMFVPIIEYTKHLNMFVPESYSNFNNINLFQTKPAKAFSLDFSAAAWLAGRQCNNPDFWLVVLVLKESSFYEQFEYVITILPLTRQNQGSGQTIFFIVLWASSYSQKCQNEKKNHSMILFYRFFTQIGNIYVHVILFWSSVNLLVIFYLFFT